LKPNHPNQKQAGAKGNQRQVRRLILPHARRQPPLPEIGRGDECREACRRVDDDTAREIHRAELSKETATPDPVRRRQIDQDRPERDEGQVGTEAEAADEGARHQRRGDDGEHHLVGEDHDEGDGRPVGRVGLDAHMVHAEEGSDIADQAVDGGAEHQAEATEHPDQADHAHADEVLDHDRQHVALLDEAAVEQGERRRHHAHQCRAEQDEGGIASAYSLHRGAFRAGRERCGIIGRSPCHRRWHGRRRAGADAARSGASAR
jgi:hypothetical protein